MDNETTAIVLCLGAASRMRPLSLSTPKALLPFCGRPLLEYTLDELHRHGIARIVVAIGRHDAGFERFETRGGSPREILAVRCGLEHGSGGILKQLVDTMEIRAERLLVIYGDSLMHVDLSEMIVAHASAQSSGCAITVGWHTPDDLVVQDRTHTNYGILSLAPERRCVQFVEKPAVDSLPSQCASAGIFLLNRKIVAGFPDQRPLDLSIALTSLADGANSPVFGWHIGDGYRFDIGTVPDYVKWQFAALEGRIGVDGLLGRQIVTGENSGGVEKPGRLLLGDDVKLGEGVRFYANNILGNRVSVGDATELRNCVVLDDTAIAAGVRMTGVVLGRSCRINVGAQLGDGTVLGDYAIVE